MIPIDSYLKAWSPLGGTIWEWLAGVASLEGVYHWGWILKFQKPMPFPVSSLCFMLVDKLLLQHHAYLPAVTFLIMIVMTRLLKL